MAQRARPGTPHPRARSQAGAARRDQGAVRPGRTPGAAHPERRAGRPAAPSRRPEAKIRRGNRYAAGAVAAVVLVLVALVLVKVTGGSPSRAAGASSSEPLAPASVVSAVASVPKATVDRVGVPSDVTAPSALSSGAPLTLPAGGGTLPAVVYVGADYCPYCAAERWAIVAALSRFGSFSGLRVTTSSSTDAYPSTYTFSFHGASYTSAVVAFRAVELSGNEAGADGRYPTLEKPDATVQHLLDTYDVPPYAPSAGGIPFLDVGNRYLVVSSQFSPSLLAGLDAAQIAGQLADPNSAVAQAVVGSANVLTAAICRATGAQPQSVCAEPAVVSAASRLK